MEHLNELKTSSILKFIFFGIIIMISLNILGIKFIKIDKDVFNSFSAIFISIILETIPFILLGSFVSAIIQVFVSEATIHKLIPKNKFFAIITASLLGFFIPICECGIIPVVRRLIKKGVPSYVAITFMLSCPIINPVVILSTYNAFYDKKYMLFLRIGFGLAVSLIIGLLLWYLEGDNKVVLETYNHHSCCCHHHKSKLYEIFDHTSHEFLDIGKFLIFGALISAIMQTANIKSLISIYSRDSFLSVVAMGIFAYVISLCSEADAFIARTFIQQFTVGSLVTFLILGPMIDIKNTLVLFSSFKKRFAVELILLIFLISILCGTFINTSFVLR
ncbi:permease [Thermobrachium celere]|uniref:Possible permease n=1 Tax=Thermobrachium celere DSM 8682 TaxID=941824 RepID=R7RQK3_9CLOT|nr:permease [Thermobrachium celere]CDF57626.1 possible permease [Thermobrachium celere DSM 8682]